MLLKNKITSIAAAVTFFILLTSATGWAQKAKLTVGGNGIVKDTVKAAFYLKGGQPFTGSQWTNNGSNIFFNAGNVGIGTGTTAPTQKLEVAGTIYSNTGGFKFPDGTIQTSAGAQQNTNATFSALQVSNLTGGGDRMVAVDASGNFKIGASFESWDRSGNILTGTLPTTPAEWFGSNNPYDVILKTNNVERMRISSTGNHPGNVGIGTDSPEKKLHVVTTHTTCATCVPETHEGIRLEDQTFDTDFNSTTTSVWDLQPFGSGFAIKRPNEIPKMVITAAGNVGIGTTNPSTNKLDVVGTVNATNYLKGGQPFAGEWITNNNDIYNGNSGNVGIGTTLSNNPNNYKLAVAGIIAAKEEIVVENTSITWPDYVFEASNNRMNYIEKELFFKHSKHLPGVDSAKEIQKNGLKFAKTIAGITQNVEENSLDIIELSKQNAELKKELEKMKKEIEIIKKK